MSCLCLLDRHTRHCSPKATADRYGVQAGGGTVIQGGVWGGGGGSGTQTFVYHQWPDQIFPMVISFFPTKVTLILGGGGLAEKNQGRGNSSWGCQEPQIQSFLAPAGIGGWRGGGGGNGAARLSDLHGVRAKTHRQRHERPSRWGSVFERRISQARG